MPAEVKIRSRCINGIVPLVHEAVVMATVKHIWWQIIQSVSRAFSLDFILPLGFLQNAKIQNSDN